MITLRILEVIPNTFEGAAAFNFFFNIIMYMGFLSWNISLLFKLINRS